VEPTTHPYAANNPQRRYLHNSNETVNSTRADMSTPRRTNPVGYANCGRWNSVTIAYAQVGRAGSLTAAQQWRANGGRW
jgi:hypothetical protein